jgi:hypothetical protein
VTTLDVSDHEILVGSGDSHIRYCTRSVTSDFSFHSFEHMMYNDLTVNIFRNYDLRMGSMVSDYVGDAVACATFTR